MQTLHTSQARGSQECKGKRASQAGQKGDEPTEGSRHQPRKQAAVTESVREPNCGHFCLKNQQLPPVMPRGLTDALGLAWHSEWEGRQNQPDTISELIHSIRLSIQPDLTQFSKHALNPVSNTPLVGIAAVCVMRAA